MIDTVLFDLDGTLLTISQDDFIRIYFSQLTKKLAPLGISPEAAVDGLWKGTAAMIQNDGSAPNDVRFWQVFGRLLSLDEDSLARCRAVCDSFYSNEFNLIKDYLHPVGDAPARAVRALREKGYRVILATNPIFPPQAVTARLGWVGLEDGDFELSTNYENSSFCKPSLSYYREICRKAGVCPGQCLMVGNSVKEDMIAEALGMDTYLITGYTEGAEGEDISRWKNGSIADFADFAQGMPAAPPKAEASSL